jgi:hypothetical protein
LQHSTLINFNNWQEITSILIDKDGNIVYSHNNYAPGDEEKLLEEIKKLGAK